MIPRAKGNPEPEADADGPSFERFVAVWYDLVDAKAHAKVRDPNLAKDLAHETWYKARRAWLDGTRPEDPQAWLLTILANETRSLFRRRRVLSLVVEPAAAPTLDPIVVEEERDSVKRVLRELSPEDRELLLLRFVEGQRPSDLRRRFGLSRSALWERIDRARRRFTGIFRLHEGRDVEGTDEVPRG